MNKNTVGSNIKRIREEKGMTQKELADKCNIIYQTIGKYERTILNPKYETLRKIAKALGVSYNLLIEPYNDSTFVCDKLDESIMLKHTFNQSIIKYGKEAQCRQAMEELAELIQAVNKMLRYADRPAEPEYYANLIEEIADVEIMLYQLKVMFNIDDDQVFAFKVEKAKREQERLKKL